MGLFDRKKKKPEEAVPPPRPAQDANDPSVYSHMRVEVTARDGQMLFVAKLMYPKGDTAELHQFSEATSPLLEDLSEAEPLPVHIRGYHDRLNKAVYMEGCISPLPKHIWQVTHLNVARVGNDRAFFRLETDVAASINKFSGRNTGEASCRMLNISVGGARLVSSQQYWEGDKFLLTVKLLEDREPSIIYCQVVRVFEKEDGSREYGCKFLELNEADQDRITENIFTAQRLSRAAAKRFE